MSDITKCKVCGYDKTDREFHCIFVDGVMERLCEICLKWYNRIMEVVDGQERDVNSTNDHSV